jgi:DNA polymerase
MTRTLGIDLETYCEADLKKCGVYAYAAHPSFEILLFAYAYDDEDVRVIDLASGECVLERVLCDLTDRAVIKTAFNAQFERTCLSSYLNEQLSPESWYCTAVQSAMLGLPLSLEGVALVLGLKQQKMKEGKDLIRYFSMPCKPTKVNGGRTRNLPEHAPEKWELFKAYCKQDVEVERAIRHKLRNYPIPETEQTLYCLDQVINDRGVRVDMGLVTQAITCDRLNSRDNYAKAKRLTGLENPNSVAQLKQWLLENGAKVESLSKKAVSDLARDSEGEVAHLLNLRLQLAKTSIRKYQAIERALCPDGRVRGLLQFYGANRTGRWSGRQIQTHNLPQNHLPDLTLARNLVKSGSFDDLEMLYDGVPNVLSELVRTAFVPETGHRFIVADFSAIEARVIAWLAGEQWRLDVFKTHGKIYEASASQMFRVPMEEITKGSPLRQKGKISELALGYGGSVGALTAMGALEMGLNEEELRPLVQAWRAANPNIAKFWWDIDRAAMKAVREKVPQKVGRIALQCTSGMLFITLPCGRKLAYVKPRLEPNRFGREGITYEGIGEGKHWSRIETYGPKLVENIVQATARDLLAEAMLRIHDAGYRIVMHVHDEVIAEAPLGSGSVEEVCALMSVQPDWADGLPLGAEGFECDYYRKD